VLVEDDNEVVEASIDFLPSLPSSTPSSDWMLLLRFRK
jgi:hypothetical protein